MHAKPSLNKDTKKGSIPERVFPTNPKDKAHMVDTNDK